jgi:myo-inositol-1(or 4)-monophosphatase
VRRAGAASLDLAYVAASRLDGFWEFGLSPWDIAAGSLLIIEAGGLIADLHGDGDYLETGDVVCGAPKIFPKLHALMQGTPQWARRRSPS